MMSETGVVPGLDEADITEKSRLGPGQMINVDLGSGTFKDNIAIKSEISKSKLEKQTFDCTIYSTLATG